MPKRKRRPRARARARAEGELSAEAIAEAEARARAEAAGEGEVVAEDEPEGVSEAEAEALAEAEAQARAEAEASAEASAEAIAEAEARARAQADAEASASLEAAAQAEAEAIAARQAAEAELEETRAELESLAAAQARAEADAEANNENDVNISNEVNVNVETISGADVRGATEDFDTSVTGERRADARAEDDDDDGLSDFEQALLLGLGAAAVGSFFNNGQEVVSNSGDRVVTLLPTGEYEVYRNDDAILRQAGSEIRTETFSDGSTRTFLVREDGTQVVTIRDGSGRVLRRSRILQDGTQVELFNDLGVQSEPVDVLTLLEESPAPVVVDSADLDLTELRALLDEEPSVDVGREFSLRQVREISAVRNLVPSVDLEVNFPTASAAIPGSQLSNLVEMGILIEDSLSDNPAEVFLIEGHTDAVGGDAYNLALSDRRAESVALALTENFDIPPENLVVQGYGEEFLKVPTQDDEAENRRASVRRITPLINQEIASAE